MRIHFKSLHFVDYAAVLLAVISLLPAMAVAQTALEEDATQWGGYEEGQPTWVLENSTEHSPTGNALNCGLTGGDPYSNIHCYRNLPADPDAKYFTLVLDFFMPDTTFNNDGAPSKVQALEFTMNQWQDEQRYEWALQWMNVGENGPQWRYWDANQPDADRWVPLNIQQELAVNTWHTLKLKGEIRNGQVYYPYFMIDGQLHDLDITVDTDSTPGNIDLLAVAVQADGNSTPDAYNLLIDNVDFYHTPDPQDNDNDGIPDDWEDKQGMDSSDPADALADRDNNGQSNLQEYYTSSTISTLQNSVLGSIPAAPLLNDRTVTDLGVQYHELAATASDASYDRQTCDVSAFWPAERVQVGGRASSSSEEVCKVQAQTDDGALKFLTKWPINNIHAPLTPSPAWAQFRFPIPQNHTATSIEYDLSWYKLFGSAPTNCHPNDIDAATGECVLDVSDDWQTNVPAGVYLSWAKPGDSDVLVTGPHGPIEQIGYSGKSTFQADVPEQYQDVDELIVSLITYNQYTKACAKDKPTSCTTHENENLELHAVRLKTSRAFKPEKQPAQQHPRILGNAEEWTEYWQPFEDLSCVTSASNSDWGSVFNVKNIWDKTTKGYSACEDAAPTSLQAVSDANFYLTPSVTATWNRDRALSVLFLLRQLKQCHQDGGSCLYSAADTQQLQAAFISYEMNRFASVDWDWGYSCFDLGTAPAMKFWSIFVDVFWSDLSTANKTTIDNKLAEKADCYLAQYEAKHWSIFNGNNWTPILGKGAMYWAIAYYHEDPRAAEVLGKVLESLWLHRDFYLDDGAYMEGIVEYTNVSYSNLREINNLLMQGFGIPLESVAWERIEKTANWYLDFMAPDGAMVDFGDSWDKLGWYTLDPLHMLLWEEMTGVRPVGSVAPDACKVKEYFSNKWFQKDLDDPWAIQPSMARDWINLVTSCDAEQQAGTHISLFENAVTGSLRQYLPGSSPLAQQDQLKFKQADQTFLAVSGTPNDFPHRELDFGALVWSAYGNRLLYDFGYGDIAKTAQGRPYLINDDNGTLLYDNLALGANTLVVEDATQSGYSGGKYDNDTINSSQIYGERGTLEMVTVGGYNGLRLNAKAVYGANDDELGWLRYFDRWMLSLDDGNFLVIDAFAVKDDRPEANVQEYWHTAATEALAESCSFSHQNVAMTLESDTALLLTPECARLERQAESNVVGRITAASLQAGAFSVEPDIIAYPNRIGKTTSRRRARFVPDAAVREDVRVFLLQAAPDRELLTEVTLEKVTCDASVCFDLTRAEGTQRIEFTQTNNQYVLSRVMARPDAFSFSSQGDAEPNTSITSTAVIVNGLYAAATISVTNGEYSIDGGPFTSAVGTVTNGQSVQVRHTANAAFDAQTDTVLTIGGVSATFSTTTKADPADTTAPVVTAPANLTEASKAYRTRFAIIDLQQQGYATDDNDGTLDIVLESVDDEAPVFRARKTAILLHPGRHILTWTATDSEGNKGSATQQVDVLPQASFLVNQSASEGDTVSLNVVLNGDSPVYPVSIPFTISGSADAQDFQLDTDVQEIIIKQPADNEQPTGKIDIALLEDDVPEGNELIFFTMSDELDNVVPGRKKRHRVKIVAQNLPPRARVRVSQNDIKGNRIYKNDGMALVYATARDPNKGDTLSYEWSSQTLVDSALDTDPTTFEIDPQAHAVGWHTVTLIVSDGALSVEKSKRLRIKSGGTVALVAKQDASDSVSTQDTDGDGILDEDERSDEKGNGIPDYLEVVGLSTHQLMAGQDNPIETDPGLVFEIGAAAQWHDHDRSNISEAQLRAYQEAEFGTYQPDADYTPTLILDYQIHELEDDGETVSLVISLSEPLPEDAALRKYDPINGWQNFLTDANNRIETAIATDGNCPTDGSLSYQASLQAGATCLRISIQDGGPNDADGLANGAIVDPLAIATVPRSTDLSNDSGGGSFALHLLMLLFTVKAFRWYRRIA